MRIQHLKINAVEIKFKFSIGFYSPAVFLGGISSGDRQRPAIRGDRQIVLPPHVPELVNEARLLCDGLWPRISFSTEALDEDRASRLMARIGLGDRGPDSPLVCSLGVVVRPSGPNARIWGDEPRWPCYKLVKIYIFIIYKICKNSNMQLTLDGALSRLLWLDTDGVRWRRGGNDLLWCCK